MKIALVGIGKIARDQHVPALSASPDWSLAATVSRHGSVAGVQAFDDLAAMLEARPDIGTVSLCLPPVPRFNHAKAALLAGRHVMLEKPPGATLSECFALEAMAREAGVSIYATWHSREAAQVAPAKAWLKDKRIVSLAVTWKEDVRRWHPGQDWIWKAGGLGVFDPGINALSIVTEILPDRFHLSEAELLFPENCETPIAANLTFAHPHGADMTAAFDFRQEGEQTWSIDILTDGGRLVLSDGGARLAINGEEVAGGGSHNDSDDGSNPLLNGEYGRLYSKMAKLVRSGGTDMDMSPMAQVADAFLIGRRVTVEPFHE
ncbi:MAG: Gfo/Idh/MocA family oxidoreductase [Brucellaceae bacterium]|nr:Gfo/Idh/MocA family oxidoreductase [Brucellaceae bacterium]